MGTRKPVRRGDIWYVDLGVTIGSETTKVRPAIIIQNNIGNEHSPITIIAPITSNTERIRPTDAALFPGETGLQQPSKALLNQIRAIDKQRLIKKILKISNIRLVGCVVGNNKKSIINIR